VLVTTPTIRPLLPWIAPPSQSDAIAHYQRLAAGQQAIAFCCNIAHAESVCAAFQAAGIAAQLLLGNTVDRVSGGAAVWLWCRAGAGHR